MSEPEHVTLAREAWEAGLIVTHLMPALYGGRYNAVLWRPDGALWVEARDQSAAIIRAHISSGHAHQQALTERPGLRLVIPGDGQALRCGCLTDTTDTTEENKLKLWCYLCRHPVKPTDVAGAIDFSFGTFPICAACVEAEGS